MIEGDELLLAYSREYKLSPALRHWVAQNQDSECRLLVEANTSHFEKVNAMIDANQGKIHRKLRLIPVLAVESPPALITELARSAWIRRIWYDAPIRAMLHEKVALTGGRFVQELGYTGKGVVVAVLDTGIFPHDDLVTPHNRILAWHDLIHQIISPYDDNGHGTHVAGIIAGNGISSAEKYQGMAPEARLIGIKVMDREGIGRVSDVIAGIEWCIDHLQTLNPKIINLSFTSAIQDSPDLDPLCRAITAAWTKGIVVCQTVENNITYRDNLHVRPGGIMIGNWNEQRILTDHDLYRDYAVQRRVNRGYICPDLVAAGVDITSLGVDNDYITMSGNSMATAMVAGGAALILEKWPFLKPEQVRHMLIKKAKNIGIGRELQGAGVLDMGEIFKGVRRKKGPKNANTHSMTETPFIGNLWQLLTNPHTQQEANNFVLKTIFSLLKNFASHS
jgi:serine protease AprX